MSTASEKTTGDLLLKLPPELRILIYEEVFADLSGHEKDDPPLFKTCRLVRDDATPTYVARLKAVVMAQLENKTQTLQKMKTELAELQTIIAGMSTTTAQGKTVL